MTGIDRHTGDRNQSQQQNSPASQGELAKNELPSLPANLSETDRTALQVIERFRRNSTLLQRYNRVLSELGDNGADFSKAWDSEAAGFNSSSGMREVTGQSYEVQVAKLDAFLAGYESSQGIQGALRDATVKASIQQNADTLLESVRERLEERAVETQGNGIASLFKQEDPTARLLSGLQDTTKNRDRYQRKVKKGLKDSGAIKELIKKPEIMRNKGNGKIGVPYNIEIPRFTYGQKGQGGVSKGDGEPGDPVDGGDPQPGEGNEPGEAGEGKGQHELEVTDEELREMIREELQLPRIEPDEQDLVVQEEEKLKSISQQGPRSRMHRKRTMIEALKRTMTENPDYKPGDPIEIVPGDERYKSFKTEIKPESGAIIIKIMDVSGSMGNEQKDLARATSYWLDFLLEEPYPDLEKRFIIHDDDAQEVDEHTFYHTTESGGTRISSALKKALDIIGTLAEHQNIYIHHFTDGDNWGDDARNCNELVKELINHPRVKHYGVFHTESSFGDGDYCRQVEREFEDEEKVVVSSMKGRDDIGRAIREQHGEKD